MALTRPKAAQINFDLTNISDPVIRLNSDKTDANDTDVGFIFERGSSGDNAAFIWDESADVFVLGTTTATGASTGDLTVSQVGLHAGSITINSAYTFPTSDGTNGQVLSTNGSGALTFQSLAATDVTISANNSTDETTYITFVDGATGSQGLETDTGLTYNPSTNTLTTSVFSGTATTAQYADLAENYVADEQYEPGTVLIFGGQQEVTASRQPDSNKIAGVVSTAPGVLMNKDCEGEFVVALAFTGRVPTKVKGTISKGDMMVSSNIEGVAVASDNPAIGTVIGKALENYDSEEVGVIEVVVGRV